MKRYIKAAKTIEDYKNMGVFDKWQMKEIRDGLEDGLDVSVYADPKYDKDQMYEIRRGLEEGVDVSWYADPEYDNLQMWQIHQILKSGYGKEQMKKIREILKEKTPQPQRNGQRNRRAYAKTIEDYVIHGLPDSTGNEFDVVKYVEIVNDNPAYWELSGSDFHDKAFELFEKDMEHKFPGDEINDDVEAKFYDDISDYGYYDEDYDEEY